ncbi:S41 family peptidase [Roseospira goensis]|uniref:Carboxyl-terminal processing protease n=1 Tax=Roseospira goensis TaxID=391922 RepID=A0A7W6S2C3_9PROT|nr:S41 family peptidase [Roseospira goensis]MBB4287125.1 carboxyl-terminal processing protease [Roseospira goensis]
MPMIRVLRTRSWLFGLLGLLVVACAPTSGPPPAAPPAGPVAGTVSATPDPFTRDAAHRMFTHGYVAVSSRYIEPVDMTTFVVAGLRGLGRIDPALDARAVAGGIELRHRDRRVAVFPRPADDRGSDWAHLSTGAIQAARAVSAPLADADSEEVYDAVFDAALASLDPFSRYAGAEEARLNRGSRNGFGGIGILFEIDDAGAVMVREVVAGGPADRAGLHPGDRILAVDGQPFTRPNTRIVRERLRGPVGSTVRLTVQRGSRVDVSLTRGLIVMPTVALSMEDGIGILRLTSFNQATSDTVAGVVRQARANGARGLIIDMRGNPGGLLDQSVTVADLFLEQGTIVSTRGRHPEARQFYSATDGDIANGLPIVVLMDGDSASAAEIVAAALQDGGRAVVIGTTSYGKGTVQTVVQLPNGGEITLTWSRFHSPSGYVLHGLGVPPVACTSGRATRTEPAVVEGVLQDLRSHATPIAQRLSSWRHTAFEDTERRRRLRALCPAEHHEPHGLDEVVARRLIQDPALYAQAIGLVGANAARR